MNDVSGIGDRIATERKLRGLTQAQLADRAHVSLSLLRKVEQGSRQVTQPLLYAVASSLGLERNDLTGQPYRTGNRRFDAVHDHVPAVRRELVSYRLSPDEDRDTPSLAAVRASTAAVSAARHAVDLEALGSLLPGALTDLRAAAWSTSGEAREEVMRLRAEVLYAARQWLHKLGRDDLASLTADLYERAALESGDPLSIALSGVLRAGELDAVADNRTARSVMSATLDQFDRDDVSGPEALQVGGFLHLNAAWFDAHAGDPDGAWSHWREAGQLAGRLGFDGDAYRLQFGPTNVGIWGTSIGVEMYDGVAAVERAEAVRLTAATPPERAGHHYLDLARGQLMNGDRPGALSSLQTARRIAPQQTRSHPMARETVRALAYAERRSSESLRGLAVWMGLDD